MKTYAKDRQTALTKTKSGRDRHIYHIIKSSKSQWNDTLSFANLQNGTERWLTWRKEKILVGCHFPFSSVQRMPSAQYRLSAVRHAGGSVAVAAVSHAGFMSDHWSAWSCNRRWWGHFEQQLQPRVQTLLHRDVPIIHTVSIQYTPCFANLDTSSVK